MTVFTVKDWRNATTHEGGGDTSTPISAAALEDLESRVTSAGGRTITAASPSDQPLILKAAVAHDTHMLRMVDSADGAIHLFEESGTYYQFHEGDYQLSFGSIAAAPNTAAAIGLYGTNGEGANGKAWEIGIDVSAATPYRDFVIAQVTGTGVNDYFYMTNNGPGANPTLGIAAPNETDSTVTIAGPTAAGQLANATLRLTSREDQTGPNLAFADSSGTDILWCEPQTMIWKPEFKLQANATSDARVLQFINHDASMYYAFVWEDNSLRFRYLTGGVTLWQTDAGTDFRHMSTSLGFYGVAATTQQTLPTGAGKTVDEVITALQTLGLVKQA